MPILSKMSNSNVTYTTPHELAEYFSKQHRATLQIFLGGAIVLLATFTYEINRIINANLDIMRIPVYVTVIPLMIFSFIYLPIKNYRISSNTVKHADAPLNSEFITITKLTNEILNIPSVPFKDVEIKFYGRVYLAKCLEFGDSILFLPLKRIINK